MLSWETLENINSCLKLFIPPVLRDSENIWCIKICLKSEFLFSLKSEFNAKLICLAEHKNST